MPLTEKRKTPYLDLTTLMFLSIVGLYPLQLLGMLMGGLIKSVAAYDFFSSFIWAAEVWVFAIWAFLREPNNLLQRYKMTAMARSNPSATARFIYLANKVNLKKIPILIRIPDTNTPIIFSFGTFSHRYIAISDNKLDSLIKSNTFDAVVLHEIGHIASGDIWKVGLSIQFTKWLFIVELSSLIQSIVMKNPHIAGMFITLGGATMAMVLFFATRILIQIREFAADEYGLSHLGNEVDLIKALNDEIIKNKSSFGPNHPNSFNSRGVSGLFTKMLGFHPDIFLRKEAARDKNSLNVLIPRMSFIFGLVVGQIASYYSNVSAGPILIGWTILFAPLFLAPALASAHKTVRFARFELLTQIVVLYCSGSVAAFFIRVFPNSFYETSSLTNNSVFLQSIYGLQQYLSYFWDIFFVMILGVPFVLFTITGVFDYIYRKYYPKKNFLTPWLLQSPINIGLFLFWTNWANGVKINSYYILFFLLFGLVWIFIFIAVGIGISKYEKKVNSI